MDKFIVSARKYRPTRFDEVVGQATVSNTLKNAIRTDHLAHSFLFCGPRGVGKTTCARILAKTINCQNLGADFEACGTCEPCVSFSQNSSLNVFELDAASNNSVEDIRNLIDQVRYVPQSGKYKIYIIDEVHMLSASAFNAFLKTLEEPPSYAIFILATTEKHKIIPTILSRCQIFDFSRIELDDIAEHLQQICVKEGIEADYNGLRIIAQKADGGLRDALSMFDRLVTFSGNNLSLADVLENLNILDYEYYFKITDAVLAGDVSTSFLLFDEISRKGFDGEIFLSGLAEHLRNLLVCLDPKTLNLLEVTGDLKERYREQASQCNYGYIINALNLAAQSEVQYKQARNKRLQVELALVKLCHLKTALKVVANGNGAGTPAHQPQPAQKYTAETKKKPDTVAESAPPSSSSSKQNIPKEKPVVPETAPVAEKVSNPEPTAAVRAANAQQAVREQEISGKPSMFGGKVKNYFESELPSSGGAASGEKMDVELKPIEIETLLSLWQQYQERKEAAGSVVLSSLMKNIKPTAEEQVVVLKANNNLQQEMFQSERYELLEYLKQNLNSQNIEIRIDIEKPETDDEPVPITASERFQHLAKKNPLVWKLKDDLHLEIEF